MFYSIRTPDFHEVEFWAVLTCHVTMAMLIGLAFRHREQLAVVRQFVGIIALWWVMAIGLFVVCFHIRHQPILGRDAYVLVGCLARTASMASSPIAWALFAWAFVRHYGQHGFRRLVATLVFSAAASLWFWGYDWGDVYIGGDDLISELYWWSSANWSVAIGWTIWYVGLFGKPVPSPTGIPTGACPMNPSV